MPNWYNEVQDDSDRAVLFRPAARALETPNGLAQNSVPVYRYSVRNPKTKFNMMNRGIGRRPGEDAERNGLFRFASRVPMDMGLGDGLGKLSLKKITKPLSQVVKVAALPVS